MNDSLLVIRKGAMLANETVMSNCSKIIYFYLYLQNDIWFVGIGQKMTEQMMSLKAIESAEFILKIILILKGTGVPLAGKNKRPL